MVRERKLERPARGHEQELAALFKRHGSLDPEVVIDWAKANPKSALHSRFNWDDSVAAHQYRLIQARNLITEVEVVYPDGNKHQVYVSPIESRGNGGYQSLVEVLSDAERRAGFLAQALAEYRRVGEKYHDLRELEPVREAVDRVGNRRKKSA